MELSTQKPQLTSLLPNEALARIERLRINSLRRRTSKTRGEHFASKGGTSTEFCDYRDYVEGDDTRFVDWNIFARLQRPYLKIYHQEEEMHVVILVDASSSMLFENKLQRAKQLAAAFGVMGLLNAERVSVYAVNRAEGAPQRFVPCTGRAKMRDLFAFLEGIEGGGDAPLEKEIEAMLKYHKGRGVAVILSDFFTFGDVKRAANMVFSSGLEIMGVQILGPSEIDPQLTGDIRLVDCESDHTLDVSSAADLLSLYQEYRGSFERQMTEICQQRSGRFLSTSAADPLEVVLFDLLRRKGWVE